MSKTDDNEESWERRMWGQIHVPVFPQRRASSSSSEGELLDIPKQQ